MLYKKLRADVLPLTDKQKRREEMKTFSNFRFHMYTEMLFGKDTEKEVANMIKKHGGTKVMFVYGGGSIKRSGLYDRVVDSLKQGGIGAGRRKSQSASFAGGNRVEKSAGRKGGLYAGRGRRIHD